MTKDNYIKLAREKGITKVADVTDFLYRLGVPGFLEDHSFFTPGARSKAATRRRNKMLQEQSARIMRSRDAARDAFNEMLESKEIQLMTRLEKLQETAKGHPDNPSVQAARRLLAKHYNIK